MIKIFQNKGKILIIIKYQYDIKSGRYKANAIDFTF